MTNALYIGQCEKGSTSKMRFAAIQDIFNGKVILIDISKQICSSNKIFKSIAWRFNLGPLVWKINFMLFNFLVKNNTTFDLIWIDKGVFIYPIILKLALTFFC